MRSFTFLRTVFVSAAAVMLGMTLGLLAATASTVALADPSQPAAAPAPTSTVISRAVETIEKVAAPLTSPLTAAETAPAPAPAPTAAPVPAPLAVEKTDPSTLTVPQQAVREMLQAQSAPSEYILRLTPDKNRLIYLQKDAASVIISNPATIGVVLDNPRLVIVMPKSAGTTTFTVLDSAGKTILEQRVVVTGAAPRYVRVRRMCASGDTNCVPVSYYYCPDGCYEVSPVQAQAGATSFPEVQGSTGGIELDEPEPAPAPESTAADTDTSDAPPVPLTNPDGISYEDPPAPEAPRPQ